MKGVARTARLALLVAGVGCGQPEPGPPMPDERDWELLCGARCAGSPVQVRVGNGYSCIRYEGGAVLCWGIRRGVEEDRDVRAHERGARSIKPSIEMPHDLPAAADLTAGDTTACALTQERGVLMCWGNTTPSSLTPQPTWDIEDAAFVRAGVSGVGFCGALSDGIPFGVRRSWTEPIRECAPGRCLVDLEGDLYCWGPNLKGQLGTGEVGPGHFLHHISELSDVVEVIAEEDYTCALEAGGDVYCWGDNFDGTIGREPHGRYVTESGGGRSHKFPSPQRVEGVDDIVRIASSSGMMCALRRDGQLFCWGDDWSGLMRLESLDGTSPESTSPVPIVDANDIVDFDLHFNHGCLIRRSGEVACWGSNTVGERGPQPASVPFGHLETVEGLPQHD